MSRPDPTREDGPLMPEAGLSAAELNRLGALARAEARAEEREREPAAASRRCDLGTDGSGQSRGGGRGMGIEGPAILMEFGIEMAQHD